MWIAVRLSWRRRHNSDGAAIIDKSKFGVQELRHAEDQHSVPEGHHIGTAQVKVWSRKGSRQAWQGTALNQFELMGVTAVDSSKEVVNFVKGSSVRGGSAASNVWVHGGHRFKRGSYRFEPHQLDALVFVPGVRVLFELHFVCDSYWVSGSGCEAQHCQHHEVSLVKDWIFASKSLVFRLDFFRILTKLKVSG